MGATAVTLETCPLCASAVPSSTLALTKLTPKQRALVDALANGAPTITAAAEIAGLSREHASVSLTKPHVAGALERAREREADRRRGLRGRAGALLDRSIGKLERALDRDAVDAPTAVAASIAAHKHAYDHADRHGDGEETDPHAYDELLRRYHGWCERHGLARVARACAVVRRLRPPAPRLT